MELKLVSNVELCSVKSKGSRTSGLVGLDLFHFAAHMSDQFASNRVRQMREVQHVGEPEATSRLSWQPVETGYGGPQENGERLNPSATPRLSLLMTRRCLGGSAWNLSVTWTTLCHARSRMAVWEERRGGEIWARVGGRMAQPSVGATMPLGAACMCF